MPTTSSAKSTLYDNFSHTNPDTALIVPSTTSNPTLNITYPQLVHQIHNFQQHLARLGIIPSTAVSIALPNSYEFTVAFLATSWQRCVAAPLNPAYKQDEFEFYIDDIKSSLVVVGRGAVEEDAPVVRAARDFGVAVAECYVQGEVVVLDVKDLAGLRGRGTVAVETPRAEDVALVLHTSGTTARPKAVPLTHANLTTTTANIACTYAITSADRTLLVMPLFHVHGLLAALLTPLHASSAVIIPPRFSASDFWHDFNTYGATWYTAVPTIHQILLKNPPRDKPKIRFIRSCSSPLSPTVLGQLQQTFEAPVLEAYAMTEAAHQMTSNPLPPAKCKPGSVGIGQGVEVAILDADNMEVSQGSEGEISIRGANVTKGYLNNPSANAESFTPGGFFRTGDQGRMDPEGYVTITGRIKELINKGGEKISPIELDNVLARHPGVAEAVSFAVDDEKYGQDIGVAVVVKEGEKLDQEELKGWMAEKVARFKMPKKVYLTATMPKTPTGKIQRRMVAQEMLKQEQPKAKL